MSTQEQTRPAMPGSFGAPLLWRLQVPLGILIAVVGAAMIVLAFSGSIGVGRLVFESLLGAAVLVPGILLAGAALTGGRATGLHLAAGELALAATIVYLGEAMPPFHHGAVGHDAAVAQFVLVVVSFVLNCAALALPAPASASSQGKTGVHWASVIRDSVLLIVGTIVLAIGLGQTANPALMPPMWNWTSFLGITIPGMLTLIFLRGPLKAIGRGAHVPRRFAIELLLVLGLSVMVFGSVTNLNLGASGYEVGFKGNGSGLALWVAAALFLVFARGLFKLVVPDGDRRSGVALVRKLLYIVGAIAFIYGEKSVIMGKPPMFTAGGAFPAAAAMVIGGILVLVFVRQAAKVMDPGAPLGPPPPEASAERSAPEARAVPSYG